MKRIAKTLTKIIALALVLCVSGPAFADALVIPSSVRIIEEEAFSGTDAEILVIPASTTKIQSKAFADCNSLTDVYLPENDVTIAEDAFDSPDELTFHAYMGSSNAYWALEHGYQLEYMTAEDLAGGGWNTVGSLIETKPVSSSSNELYYTHRLIVCLNSGYEIPDVNNFKQEDEEDPVVVPLEQGYYVIQFSNPTSARNCAKALEAWEGCKYAEADYFISESLPAKSALKLSATARTDYMGFQTYTEYLGNVLGENNDRKVTVAVIDTGVNSSQVSCSVSSKSYDLVNSRNKSDEFEDMHGTNVANQICNAFGTLAAKHLEIISYRVVRPSDSRASYLLVGNAIRRAKDDGANFINISQVFESTYIKDQDNMYLQECISYFGSGRIYAAAGNNAAMSAKSALPARYCQSVTGAQYGDDGITLVRAPGTATGANYAGYDTTTSFATAKVVAAAALLSLDSDPTHTLNDACVFVTSDCGKGMPDLTKYAVTPVTEIILNNGEPIESLLEIGDRASIDYEVLPENATVSTITVTSSNPDIVEVISNSGIRVRVQAKAKGTAYLAFTADDGNVDPVIVPITVVKPVTSVNITGNTDETLMKDETLPLTVNVLPEDATDRAVTWTSGNENIATVSETGVVTQKGTGTVVITATSNFDPTISDSVILTVSDIPAETGVTVSAPKTLITIGTETETLQMIAAVLPEGTNQTVTWNVDRPEVATIDEQTGLLTAVSTGEVIVTATSGSGKSGYMGITVAQLPTSVSINGPESVNVGEAITLAATVLPDNAKDKTVTWTSATPTVATVDSESGTVTGIKEGIVVILATSKADRTVVGYYAVTVTVLPDSVVIDEPESASMDIDEELTLSATVSPTNASNKTIYWSSSDSAIASVSTNGVVTAKQPGTVEIIASTANGNTDRVTLTIRQPYALILDANGGNCETEKLICYSGYEIGNILPTPDRTGYTFRGWYSAANGGTQLTTSSIFTSSSTVTVYAHWSANEYTFNIVYESSNGTPLGKASVTKIFGTTDTITPPVYTGYTTPEAQNVTWDENEKTVTFVYPPKPVDAFNVGTYTWCKNPKATYHATVHHQNRTADSVEICVSWKTVLESGYMQNAQKFSGSCNGVAIPTTTVVSFNEWAKSSSSERIKIVTSSWVTIPLTTTEATTISVKINYYQYDSNGKPYTGSDHSKVNATWTVSIPAY